MKTAIVTGASSGIGAVIAQTFLENDFKVIVCARNENEFTKNLGPAGKFIAGDVTLRMTHQKLIKTALDWTGKLDVYVNNAGISMWRPIQEIDEEFLNSMIDTNLKSAFWGSQAAAAALTKGGTIINISSLAGKRGSANNSAYCATKFGVNGLTQSLAKELGAHGIRVNAVCPVYVKTPGLLDALRAIEAPAQGKNLDQYFQDFSMSQAALKRLPEATEIAKTCLFLASDNASAVTGQCLNVDCGVLPS